MNICKRAKVLAAKKAGELGIGYKSIQVVPRELLVVGGLVYRESLTIEYEDGVIMVRIIPSKEWTTDEMELSLESTLSTL